MGVPSPRRSVGSAVRKNRHAFGAIWPLLLALAPVPAAPSLVAKSCRHRDAAGVDAAGLACAVRTWRVLHGARGEGNMPAGRAGWGWGRWLQGPFPSWILAVCLPQSLLLVNRALGAWDNREEEHDFPLADADATRSRHGGSGEHSTLSVSFVVEVKPSTVACAPWPTGAAGRVAATTFPVLPAAQPPLGDTAASLWRGGSVPSREGSRREALLRSGMVGRARDFPNQLDFIMGCGRGVPAGRRSGR